MPDTVREMLLAAGRRYENHVAVRFNDQERRYGHLIERATQLANALAGAGIQPGERVGVMVEDRLEPIEAYAACAIGGFVAVAVNHRLTFHEASYVLSDSGSRALIHTDGVSEVVDATGVSSEMPVFTIGDDVPRGALRYEDVLAGASKDYAPTAIDPTAPSLIGYTSGTTGKSKGAIYTQARQMDAIQMQCIMYRMPMYGALAFTGSLSFIGGLNAVVYPTFLLGGVVRFMGPFDPERWFACMASDRSTLTFAPTPMVRPFLELGPKNMDVVRNLTAIPHSAAPAPREDLEQMIEICGDRFIEAWGMTESLGCCLTATTAADRRKCDADDPVLTVGRNTGAARVFAIRDDGTELPLGSSENGELVAESDVIFRGYWNRPDETAAVLTGDVYKTGDLGRIDASGYVYLSGGRVSDMIISGAMNVYPIEVETALLSHPDIEEVAVFGVPDQKWGETVVAAVHVRGDARVTESEVIDYVRTQIASYKKPTRVHFVDDFPKTVSMKIKKHELKTDLGYLD
jgi:fatty-acyl-CoA synthase